jgi:hypothetical protein
MQACRGYKRHPASYGHAIPSYLMLLKFGKTWHSNTKDSTTNTTGYHGHKEHTTNEAFNYYQTTPHMKLFIAFESRTKIWRLQTYIYLFGFDIKFQWVTTVLLVY